MSGSRWIRRCVMALCLGAFAGNSGWAAGQNGATASHELVVAGQGNATSKLGGMWQFHVGDDPSWAAAGFADSSWEGLSAEKSWGMQGHEGYTGYAWYRRHLDVTEVPGGERALAIYIPRVEDAYEVFWNGRRVGTFGKMPPQPVTYYQAPPATFGLGTDRMGVLAIRVWKAPLNSFDPATLGGLTGTPVIGSPGAIEARKALRDYTWLRGRQYYFGLLLAYALVTMVGLFVWLRDREQRAVGFVAIFCLANVVGAMLTSAGLPLSASASIGWLQPVLSLKDISLWYLLLYLLRLDGNARLRRWTWWLAVVAIVTASLDGAVLLFDPSGGGQRLLQAIDAVLTVGTTAVEVFPLVLVAMAARKRLDAARWLIAIFAFLQEMIFVTAIAAQQGQRYTHWTWWERLYAPLFNLRGNKFAPLDLTALGLFVSIVYALYRYAEERSARQGAIEQEFRSAQELQRVLVPQELPPVPGYGVTSAYLPAQEVGGDFFQVIEQPNGSTIVVIGDVSGKGLKAAMTVALIIGALRTLAEMTESPSEILAGLNRRLHGRMDGGFVTCLALRLQKHGACAMATAAHPAPFLNDFELLLCDALPMGLLPDAVFEETTLQLEVGDRLMLYTDGLLEARNADGDLYSFERLQELAMSRPDAHEASEAAVAFGQDDDITVLTITRLAVGAEPKTSLMAPKLVPAEA